MQARRRYAVVGTGGRCVMFIDGIVERFPQHCELVAFCDISQTRMNWHNKRIKEKHNADPVPTYRADQFDQMVRETRPDVVVVTSMDGTHHTYIVRAMELGCDAISEKPMTTDAVKARAIFDAIERTGRSLRVSFNLRYTPEITVVKQLIQKGVVGKPLHVDMMWVLDTSHGADYFRRWHATKANSGGLLVHKATHHFDMINWWIDSWPQTVFCMGETKFYGKKAAASRGETYSYDRYTGHPEAKNDPFALDLTTRQTAKELYYDAEADSGYIRDKNVFGEHVDIEDSISLTARYRNGVIFNYSLVAYSPWEGFRAAITGTKGRVEISVEHGSHIIVGQGDKELAAEQEKLANNRKKHTKQITVFPMFGRPYDVEIPAAEGAHGGADPVIQEQLFSPDAPPDPLGRTATHLDGAASMLMGASANESIRTGQPVHCDDLLALPRRDAKPVTV